MEKFISQWLKGIKKSIQLNIIVLSLMIFIMVILISIYSNLIQDNNIITFIAMVGVLLLIIQFWYLKFSIINPLKALAQGEERSKEREQYRINLKGREDEIGEITNRLMEMSYAQEIYKEELHQNEIRILETELKLLQSQMNPHFLYNTFDSIYWMAKKQDMEEISEMVLNLSMFFRINLNKGMEAIPLEEAINNLQYYIRIQQIRFMDRFTYQFKIAEETKNLPMLKIILQPIVENAFIHGLERQTSEGNLSIISGIESKYLKIEIIDNGIGIRNDRLQYIKEELNHITIETIQSKDKQAAENNGLFGLRNVKSRLILFYGENCSLDISSQENEGTCVTIKIPLTELKTAQV